ncbi:MAG: methylenetetrahydrofolate--tRNA-(uracil(54)-C(5))-methyltransferase (FADH(2)-oxidizing) TrmFO [Gracilibacteraceae bacterium]|jgi:methylenetetrahydrofolate--tRNA-(uracil-5-)-methyltransferase|nr:methylenetetrahydrofolate--tRNA-(uracil(54)-C(5))-methyltransferase (FADH(2)-oxidizing) TrmFO [Gracilibacteraceae bacterium]
MDKAAEVAIIGAGLAGAEAAWQLARRGVRVVLWEMRPERTTPAHVTGDFAELVCSNSLRSDDLANAAGLLKAEMERLGSLVIAAARATATPAGGALAVDRARFSAAITKRLLALPAVRLRRAEAAALPPGPAIIAAGPLASPALAAAIRELTGRDSLYFFDAAAPIVTLESVDQTRAFWASRYDKGGRDYLNCPLNEEEYLRFHAALLTAETAEIHGFEQKMVFEGCMPIEVMASRGLRTMAFGPLKPVGLTDPRTGRPPWAAVQLRKENLAGDLLNLVGFQTHLRRSEQERVFRMIPGLERAEFARYGVMHRNTYIRGPAVLNSDFSAKARPDLFFAGQITGVEGYIESAASGLMTALSLYRRLCGRPLPPFPPETALGGLAAHITASPSDDYQPMNVTFGLLPPLAGKIRGKREKNRALAARALAALDGFSQKHELTADAADLA